MKKPPATSSPGYNRKQVFILEAKTSPVSEGRNEGCRDKGPKKTENNATNSKETDDETCPLDCKPKHHLAACPKFQNLTVNQKWEIVKQHWRCRKCLRAQHKQLQET